MATQIVLRGGQALAVWDDRWRPLYEALGTLRVQRATDVEFDAATGEWVATHRGSGRVIASGVNRSRVVAEEVAWLEANGIEVSLSRPDGDASIKHKA